MPKERRSINRVHPDLAQLKALAHPVRLDMLGKLRVDGPATASQLAQRLGLNSGATSYHLRELAKAGLVVDDSSRGNKRDRWWKAAHESTETEPAEVSDVEERAVLGAYHSVVAHSAIRQIEAAAAEAAELPDEWANLVGASDWNLLATPDQVRQIKYAVHEILTAAVESAPETGTDAMERFVFQFHSFPLPGSLVHRDVASD